MRIVHISDIHLSSANISDLKDHYLGGLISDLNEFNKPDERIDFLIIGGDLVDQGGESLGDDPYNVFAKTFLIPLAEGLKLKNEQILFIPGNHDIQRKSIHTENEGYLTFKMDSDLANTTLDAQRSEIKLSNERIQKFKEFEKQYHEGEEGYLFSYNESIVVKPYLNYRIGFALINDSWRCSHELTKQSHFIGTRQLYNAKNCFEEKDTALNIAIFHHPLEFFNSEESKTIESILQSFSFDIVFFGHKHEHKYESIISPSGGITVVNGRTVFSKVNEVEARYQPGYSIIDIKLEKKVYKLFARKFALQHHRFISDLETYPDGFITGQLQQNLKANLYDDSVEPDNGLPGGYSADYKRIVQLLIGKSIYPNPYIFARELIQNSVDACNRVIKSQLNLAPKIVINIDSNNKTFEVSDDGDGMSKYVLREHFSVVGKSISQDTNQQDIKLISQFGIGFISTFRVAKRVEIWTRSKESGQITFYVDNVFKGFKYDIADVSAAYKPTQTGTIIKVYLNDDFSMQEVFNISMRSCRHIDNLRIIYDNQVKSTNSSWNLENAFETQIIDRPAFECRLAIKENPTNFIASSGGFMLNDYCPSLLLPYFPSIICGEVNFAPTGIDYDISRTNVLATEKAHYFKTEISPSLIYLFRAVLDSKEEPLKKKVVNFLQFFLVQYDSFKTSGLLNQYSDFYKKRELISLCLEHSHFSFRQKVVPLAEIFFLLKNSGITTIYLDDNSGGEVTRLVARSLSGNGHLVVNSETVHVTYQQQNTQSFNYHDLVRIVAAEQGISHNTIQAVSEYEIQRMQVSLSSLDVKLNESIIRTAARIGKTLKITRFGGDAKLQYFHNNIWYLNFDHQAFQIMIQTLGQFSPKEVDIYILGMVSSPLSSIQETTFNFPT